MNGLILHENLDDLLEEISHCRICDAHLPLGPRPVVQMQGSASLLIIGQAPGTRVHKTGIPWDDPSGERLRQWLQLSPEQFYNTAHVAIMPMGFCYPGKGRSGDLPPRKECAEKWHSSLRAQLPQCRLTLLIGQYAQAYYLGPDGLSLTERVKQWQNYLPTYVPLPHPSPRNRLWLKKNPWFERDTIPHLQSLIRTLAIP